MAHPQPKQCLLSTGLLWGGVALGAAALFAAAADEHPSRKILESGFPATVVNATNFDGSAAAPATQPDLQRQVVDLGRKVRLLEAELKELKRQYRPH